MMRGSRTIAAVLAGACAMCIASVAGAATAQPGDDGDDHGCIYPRPSTVLGRDIGTFDDVDFRGFRAGDVNLRWLFISWGAPPDGMVFVLTCGGRAIAKLNLGNVRQITQGPWIGQDETIQVIYVPGSGTGINLESVALLRFDGKSIVKLWDHDSDDISSFSSAMLGGALNDERLETKTDHYDWRYSKSGKEIAVSGNRTIELGGRIRHTALPREKFCYRAAKHQFLRCR
jgi:hypothetical protein